MTHPSDIAHTATDDEREALVREARVWAALIGTKPQGARELFNRLADALESTPRAAHAEPSDTRVVAAIRKVVEGTPDIREPGTWWPLGLDSEEFKRGARWAENWWRIQIARAFEAGAR